MNPKIPVPTFDQTFRDWVTTSVLLHGGEDYRCAAERWVEERWAGSTTRSLHMHLRAREYCDPDARVFAHLRDVWEKWLILRAVMDNDQYDYDT